MARCALIRYEGMALGLFGSKHVFKEAVCLSHPEWVAPPEYMDNFSEHNLTQQVTFAQSRKEVAQSDFRTSHAAGKTSKPSELQSQCAAA